MPPVTASDATIQLIRERLATLVNDVDSTLVDRMGVGGDVHAAGLDLVRVTGCINDEVAALLKASVAAARSSGASCAAIGEALGASRQGAAALRQRESAPEGGPTDEGFVADGDVIVADGSRWRMTPVNAYDELARLERAGVHG